MPSSVARNTAPTGPRASIVRAEGIECARCMLRECPIDHRCMTRISADEVAERALVYLKREYQSVRYGERERPELPR